MDNRNITRNGLNPQINTKLFRSLCDNYYCIAIKNYCLSFFTVIILVFTVNTQGHDARFERM